MKRRGIGGEVPAARKRRTEEQSAGVSIKLEGKDPARTDAAGAETSGEESAKREAGSEKSRSAPFGTPTPSTPPKVAGQLKGAGKQPLATSELGLGRQFGGWSSRSARLLAVYVRQHYKQARPAEWRAMVRSPASGDTNDEAASVPQSHGLAGLEGHVGDSTAATRRVGSGPGPTVIDMDTDDLNDDLSCPICLRVIRKAVTTIECLHRFCTECIEKSLRLGQKECPTCRERCPSRRFLRPDPNFDALIGKSLALSKCMSLSTIPCVGVVPCVHHSSWLTRTLCRTALLRAIPNQQRRSIRIWTLGKSMSPHELTR